MAWPKEVNKTVKRLSNVKTVLDELFVGRTRALDLLVLATVCREHLLLIGPPGTAKTELINRYTELIDAKGFHYLLTRFSEPSELFGPLDLALFQKGTYHIRTESMLPEAQIAFLDEVFLGNSAILNALLTLLNERVFHNGAERQKVPLLSLIGATNTIPDDPSLRAFADRFMLRCRVDQIEDESIDNLLASGWELERDRIESQARGEERELPRATRDDVIGLHQHLAAVDISEIRPEYGRLIQEIRAEGVDISDRRAVKGLKLIAGAALLRGAETAGAADLWPLLHIWSRGEEAEALRGAVEVRLAEAGVATLSNKRTISEIILDLDTLEAQSPRVRNEAAMAAHLGSLNKLRRELINDHPTDKEARQRVETAIGKELNRMESVNV